MNICLVYGYGQLADGALDAQTKARCRRTLTLFQKKRISNILITVGMKKQNRFMGEEMQNFFLQHDVPQKHIFFSPKGCNTAGETDECIALMHTFFPNTNVSVVVVSSWYHLPRIFYLWLARGYVVACFASYRATHLKDLLIEPLKMINAILFPFSSAKIAPLPPISVTQVAHS